MPQSPATLSAAQKSAFGRDGFLVLPKFFDDETIDRAQQAIDEVKRRRPMDVVIDNLHNGARTVLGLMTPADIQHDRMKINDLYLTMPEMRELALPARLAPLLAGLLGHVPALCNSLFLERGSQQEPHVDALYMTPRTPGHLIATWVALEDALEGSGLLEYFPGSHRIPQWRFSHGGFTAIAAEEPAWRDYILAQAAAAGLPRKTFAAAKGDVFIWHAHLLHGGGAITNPTLTRKSCVFHFFSEADARAGAQNLVPLNGGFWINRPPQAVPADIAAQLPFSEANYLARYADVAAAIRAGTFRSGLEHYEAYGKQEGRVGS